MDEGAPCPNTDECAGSLEPGEQLLQQRFLCCLALFRRYRAVRGCPFRAAI